MSRKDPELGKKIQHILESLHLEGPYLDEPAPINLEELVRNRCSALVSMLGLNLDHPSTKDTPDRLSRMYLDEVCYGMDYKNFPSMMLVPTDSVNLVLERKCLVHSLCEHHFMPIIGIAHVAYIPTKHLIGLSKINRIVDFFSRRPQLQERLGEQIATALSEILQTKDVAVIIRADHLCTRYRGVKDPQSDTVTSSMHGRFFTVAELRAELMQLLGV